MVGYSFNRGGSFMIRGVYCLGNPRAVLKPMLKVLR